MASRDILSDLIKLGAAGSAWSQPLNAHPQRTESKAPETTTTLLKEVCEKTIEALDKSIQSQQEFKEALVELSALCGEEVDIPIYVEETES